MHPAVMLPPGVAAHGLVVHDVEAAVVELERLAANADELQSGAVPRRRAEYLAGRHCAARALAALGCGEPVRRHEDGTPEWPTGFVGSITHSHGRVLAVASRHDVLTSVGVDLELLVAEHVVAELAPRVLDGAEQQALAGVFGGASGGVSFTVAFSAKESLYKCLYPFARRVMDYPAARVVAVRETSPAAGELTLELACGWTTRLAAGHRLVARYARTGDAVETVVTLPALAAGPPTPAR